LGSGAVCIDVRSRTTDPVVDVRARRSPLREAAIAPDTWRTGAAMTVPCRSTIARTPALR